MTRILIALAALIAACSPAPPAPAEAPPPGSQIAVFAGGCFWSAEKAFENVRGVSSVVSGFAGGTVANPTYAQVVRGGTGHREAIQVTFDPTVVSYRALVDRFWRTIDPTDPGGTFCDRGPSYETAVFATAAQRPAATASRAAAERALGQSFTTPVLAAARFWPAGNEHQDYARRNPGRYEAYRVGCRRSPALRRVWGDAAVE
ncbi:peptide-methionine (S)-S-oxide reductase MsrA [Brevundimonas sp.]|uniref:peptide-methionine (S)-S-oxide reductase MsrA n=1 Tax=Brevundimonas sp. TaxID=1871086 RepID=UPI003AF7C00E